MSKRMGVEQMRAALNAEMQAANANRAATGTGNPLPAAEPGEFGTGTAIIRLRVSEVDAYDDNPRTEPNGKYAESGSLSLATFEAQLGQWLTGLVERIRRMAV